MRSSKEYVVLNYVDTPLKILFWTKGEIALFFLPMFFGLCFEFFVAGIVLSFLSALLINRYKKTFGRGQLQSVTYWFMLRAKPLAIFPEAFKQEFPG